MIIRVTQEHIDKGIRGIFQSCPIALAMGSAGLIDSWAGVSVLETKNFKSPTPLIVEKFIERFDNKLPVEPFEFEIPDFT